jgi:two-component system LytT family response regulator
VKIRCLLVDDEPLALTLLATHLRKFEKFEVVATSANAVEALHVLSETPIDLLFLDIRMGGLSGIDFLKSLKAPPQTILTTAYREFALEGYELDVVDYLLKPITFERFFKAIERYLRHQRQRTPASASLAKGSDILLKAGPVHYKLDTTSILYIESVKDCVKIYGPEKYTLVKYKIGELEQELRSHGFVRIHRSFLVNTQKVTAFSATRIVIGEQELPVGTNYRPQVATLLRQGV